MEILFEDRDIIVVCKDTGILSQRDESGNVNLQDMISDYLSEKGEKGETFVLHRLDRNVGGVMVYAKNKRSAAQLSGQIQKRVFMKEYLAVIHSKPEQSEGVFEDLLFKDSKKNKSYVVTRARKGVKDAKLSYKLLGTRESEYGEISLVRVLLHTGRTHQIRVQCSSRKMPLVGDGKYGGSDKCESIGLWSCSVSFIHPSTGEKVTFEKIPDIPLFTF